MNAFLIDSHGDLWSANSRDVRHAYDSPYSGGEFTAYAIRNLGFIGLHEFGASCHLKLNAAFVTEKALEACFQRVTARPSARYILSLQENGDRLDLFSSLADLFRSIECAVLRAKRAKLGDYLSAPIAQPQRPAIARLHEALRQAPVDFSDPERMSGLTRLIGAAFGNRFVIARASPERSTLTFDRIGDDLFTPYSEWRARAHGLPVSALPDPTYGEWVARSYYEALESQTALSERIDAIVRWPHAGKMRMRYRRVILPFVGASGAPQLISGTVDDVNIDLRIKSA